MKGIVQKATAQKKKGSKGVANTKVAEAKKAANHWAEVVKGKVPKSSKSDDKNQSKGEGKSGKKEEMAVRRGSGADVFNPSFVSSLIQSQGLTGRAASTEVRWGTVQVWESPLLGDLDSSGVWVERASNVYHLGQRVPWTLASTLYWCRKPAAATLKLLSLVSRQYCFLKKAIKSRGIAEKGHYRAVGICSYISWQLTPSNARSVELVSRVRTRA